MKFYNHLGNTVVGWQGQDYEIPRSIPLGDKAYPMYYMSFARVDKDTGEVVYMGDGVPDVRKPVTSFPVFVKKQD